MQRISDSQMEAQEEACRRSFRKQVRVYLSEEMPEATHGMSDDEIDSRIKLAESTALSYGISEPVPLVQYICLVFASPPGFDSDPDVKAYLEKEDLDEETKMQSLINAIEDIEGS